jgi:hypothetical protein
MGVLVNYFSYNLSAIVLSKLNTGSYIKLKKIVCFFIIDTKHYKKNLVLFFIIVSILFCRFDTIKKRCVYSSLIIKLIIKSKKFIFLQKFIHFYLPLLGSVGNSIKLGSFVKKTNAGTHLMLYRINYFTFPVMPELDLIYGEYEFIYNIVTNYRMQLDFVLKVGALKIANFFLIRMYKLPCIFKGKKIMF